MSAGTAGQKPNIRQVALLAHGHQAQVADGHAEVSDSACIPLDCGADARPPGVSFEAHAVDSHQRSGRLGSRQ